MELVSVVIPTHNRASLLKRAVESVIRQTYRNIEIIVVSDGSTDETKHVVNTLGESDCRVKFDEYFPSRNGNVARNTGINLSKGSFIAFLDDDDEWAPDKIEKQMNVILANDDIGMVYTGAKVVYAKERIEYLSIPRKIKDLKTKILLSNVLIGTSAVLIRASILRKVGCFDEQLPALQDYDLWIRICQCCDVVPISEPLVINNNSLGVNQISVLIDKYKEAFDYLDKKYVSLLSCLSSEQIMMRESLKYYDLANRAMRNSNPKNARMLIKKAMNYKFRLIYAIYYFLSFTTYTNILRIRKYMK